MSSVLVIQHTPFEGLGRIEPLLRAANVEIRLVTADAPLPDSGTDGASGIVLLGGPMGVHDTDRYPRLRREMQLIEDALRSRLPVLGLCLGSQLMATVLGADVRRGTALELGWLDVEQVESGADDLLFRHLPPRFKALHWHGDIFDLPPGTRRLARSEMTTCQGFRHGPNAWGILFHLEAGPSEVAVMADAFKEDVAAAGTTRERLLEDAALAAAATAAHAADFFGAWISLLATPSRR